MRRVNLVEWVTSGNNSRLLIRRTESGKFCISVYEMTLDELRELKEAIEDALAIETEKEA